jgi:hypothetical protein
MVFFADAGGAGGNSLYNNLYGRMRHERNMRKLDQVLFRTKEMMPGINVVEPDFDVGARVI